MVIFRSLQPEAAPTESFTEPEAIMLENINEFNNQLSHWRQRLTIPNTDQIQVIRDRLDQTVSMVCYVTYVLVQNIGGAALDGNNILFLNFRLSIYEISWRVI